MVLPDMRTPRELPPGARLYDPERDGVSATTLTRFKNCRELARLHLNGVTPMTPSSAQIFGSVVHEILHRSYEDIRLGVLKQIPTKVYIKKQIAEVERIWRTENPTAGPEAIQSLELTMMLTETTMPLYFNYWKKDLQEMNWRKLEGAFKVPLFVPSIRGFKDRLVPIMGKIDGAFLDSDKMLRLFETKTKSRIEEGRLSEIIKYELQVGLYMIALWKLEDVRPRGLVYNIIRRPLLRQKATENLADFAARITEDIRDRPDWYFIRMEMFIDEAELVQFEVELMDLMADFVDWWEGNVGHYKNSDYCENKYGTCPMLPICGSRDFTSFYIRPRTLSEVEEW